MRRGQLIVLVNGDNHMLKERCSCMIIVVTCFICRNWFRSHQGMMRGRVTVVMVIGILAFVCVSHVTNMAFFIDLKANVCVELKSAYLYLTSEWVEPHFDKTQTSS